MATITDIPLELLELIVGEISSENDIGNLRLVCKHLDEMLAPRLLSTVYLNFENCTEVRRLVYLSTEPSRVHIFARNLKLRCLAPGISRHIPPNIIMETGGNFRYEPWNPSNDVVEAIKIVTYYLPKIFRHFRNLEAVEWKTHGYDPITSNKMVTDLLFSQKDLRIVSIDMSCDMVFPIPMINRLSGLTQLSIIFPRVHFPSAPLLFGLSQALQNCPGLLSFYLNISDNNIHPTDLANLDLVYGQLASLYRIMHLSLLIPNALGLTKFRVLNNLTHLTSLNVRTEHAQQGFGQLWARLKEQHIKLKIISFNILHMVPAFVDYLMSYSGAEELRLSNKEMYWFNPNNDYTELATGFFNAITSKHSSTLRVLTLNLSSHTLNRPRAWGPVDVNRPQLLVQLTALRKLEIQLYEAEKKAIVSSTSEEYERLGRLLKLLG